MAKCSHFPHPSRLRRATLSQERVFDAQLQQFDKSEFAAKSPLQGSGLCLFFFGSGYGSHHRGAVPVQKHRQAAGVARCMEQVIHAGFAVDQHASLKGIKGTAGYLGANKTIIFFFISEPSL